MISSSVSPVGVDLPDDPARVVVIIKEGGIVVDEAFSLSLSAKAAGSDAVRLCLDGGGRLMGVSEIAGTPASGVEGGLITR